MAVTVSDLVDREPYEGKRVVETLLTFSNGSAATVALRTKLGMTQVDEVWIKANTADTDSVQVTSAIPAYAGGTDIQFTPTGALATTVRFIGS